MEFLVEVENYGECGMRRFSIVISSLILSAVLLVGLQTTMTQAAPMQQTQVLPCPTTSDEASAEFGALPRHWDQIQGVPEGNCGWALLAGGELPVNIYVPDGYIYLEQEGLEWPPTRWEGPLWIFTNYGEVWRDQKPEPTLIVATSAAAALVGSPITLSFSVNWSDSMRVYSEPSWDLPEGEYTSNNCTRVNANENSMWDCPVGVINTLTITPTEARALNLEVLVFSDYYNGVVANRRLEIPVLTEVFIRWLKLYCPIIGQ